MKKLFWNSIFSIVLFLSCVSPVFAIDEDSQNENEEIAFTPTVVINEIQTNGLGSGTSNEEFVELVNLSLDPVDISGWTLEYVNTSGNSSIIFTFGAPSPFITLDSGEYLLGTCKDAPAVFLADLSPTFAYNNCLAASGAGLVLKNNEGVVVDNLYWVSGPDSFSEDIVPLLDKGYSIQRRVIAGLIVATGNNINDFEVLEEPTPETGEFTPPDDEEVLPDENETTEDEATTDEEQNEETAVATDEQAQIILPVLLSELYVDPANPLTDSQDEWVEIYNPNNQIVNLEDYIIYTGSTFSYKHVFGAGDTIAPNSYMTITAGESSLALSNSGGKAKIVGSDGQIFDETAYTKATNGMSWAKTVDNVWSWSSTPTQNAANIITSLPVKIKTASSTTKKTSTKTTKTTKSTSVKASTTTDENINSLVDAPGPLPNWLLATLGTLAVLYCLYEYRYEVSNKIYQLREYRSNRR